MPEELLTSDCGEKVGENLIDLTSTIVTAYLAANPVTTADLPGLINAVHSALATVGEENEQAAAAKPAVPIKKSVKPDAITCLECGKKFSMLKRHLATDHGMTPEDYRERWNLDANYPMTAPDYAARRSQLAISSGLGRKRLVEEDDAKPQNKPVASHHYPASRWSK